MVLQITNTTLPGVSLSQDSAGLVAIQGGSPADAAIIGEADLINGSATEATYYRITTAPQATRVFGDSPLGNNVAAALQNGAYPVHAVAATETDVVGEDISGIGSTSGTLANAPVVEDASLITFTVDGVAKTTILTLKDPSTEAVGADEVYLNAQTGAFELDAAPGDATLTNDTVDYPYLDYGPALTEMEAEVGATADFLGVLSENSAVTTALQTTVDSIASLVTPILGIAGASPYIADTATYVNPLDTSRMQLLYPMRNGDGNFVLGEYLGLRARLGIDRSGMRQRLTGVEQVYHNLTEVQKTDLDAEHVVVLESDSRGIRLLNDPTCVADANLAEAQMANGLARLVVDVASEIVYDNSDRFIGKLHTQGARDNLRAVLQDALDRLTELNAVIGTVVTVEEVDAQSARVEVGIELAKPLRNIEAVVAAGEFPDAASA